MIEILLGIGMVVYLWVGVYFAHFYLSSLDSTSAWYKRTYGSALTVTWAPIFLVAALKVFWNALRGR